MSDFVMPTMSDSAFDPNSETIKNNQQTHQDNDDVLVQQQQQHNDPTMAAHQPKSLDDIKLRFRTYQPHSKDLKQYQIATATQLQDFDWITTESQAVVNSVSNFDDPDYDFIEKYPLEKNPTWDLKRDLAPQTNLLQRRTQDSIALLMQQKLLQTEINDATK